MATQKRIATKEDLKEGTVLQSTLYPLRLRRHILKEKATEKMWLSKDTNNETYFIQIDDVEAGLWNILEDTTKLARFTTINGLAMINCEDYNWLVVEDNDGTEVFKIELNDGEGFSASNNITLLYGQGNMAIQHTNRMYGGDGDVFLFKMPFEDSPKFVKSLLDAEELTLSPIFHKDTVIKKK